MLPLAGYAFIVWSLVRVSSRRRRGQWRRPHAALPSVPTSHLRAATLFFVSQLFCTFCILGDFGEFLFPLEWTGIPTFSPAFPSELSHTEDSESR